jgi:Uma2 family endonuclease
MSEAIPQLPFFTSRDAYRTWAVSQTRGRFERIEGEVIAMSPERYGHTRTKYQACKALERAIHAAGVPCQAIIDGITVEVGDDTDFEPDAMVNCGEPPKADDIAAPNPIIVVEVISRSTRSTDTGAKLAGYFKVPSIQHYLVLNPDHPSINHHKRQFDGTILTRIITSGAIILDPPGIQFDVSEIYGGDT